MLLLYELNLFLYIMHAKGIIHDKHPCYFLMFKNRTRLNSISEILIPLTPKFDYACKVVQL